MPALASVPQHFFAPARCRTRSPSSHSCGKPLSAVSGAQLDLERARHRVVLGVLRSEYTGGRSEMQWIDSGFALGREVGSACASLAAWLPVQLLAKLC